MSQIKVIIGANTVYATQYKKICFQQSFANEFEKRDAKHNAQSCAFGYACYEVKAVCDIVENDLIKSSDDVFAYLEKCHAPVNYPAIS